MARTVLTYDGLDMNDGVNYFLLPGFDPGEKIKTYDEVVGLDGDVVQLNVAEAGLITMVVPLRIEGSSEANLETLVAAINTKVDAGDQTLVHGPSGDTDSYSCVESPRVNYVRDQLVKVVFAAFIVWNPVRTP